MYYQFDSLYKSVYHSRVKNFLVFAILIKYKQIKLKFVTLPKI